MNEIFNDLKTTANNIIKFAHDGDLNNDNFANDLLHQMHTEFPALEIKNAKFDIKKGELTRQNVSYDFYFTPGTMYESYYVSIPVKNSIHFESIFKTISNSSFKYDNGSLIYQEWSDSAIEGNEQNILNLRNNFKLRFEVLNEHLEQQKVVFDNFLKNDFIRHIENEVKNEISKRKIKKQSKDLLNPFN